MSKNQRWITNWQIVVEAASAEQAATFARFLQLDPKNQHGTFTVQSEDGATKVIDLCSPADVQLH
jgi:hypothetical protein